VTAIVQVLSGGVLKSTTATAFCRDTAGNLEFIVDQSSTLGDGVHPVVTTDVGQISVVQCFNFSSVTAHALAGLGSTISHVDGCSGVTAPQDVTTNNVFFVDKASQTAYTPGFPGNWQPAPTLVNAALDQLAAPNVIQGFLAAGSGAVATLTVPTGNIAKLRSGKVQVDGFIGGSNSQAATITVTLLRDAAVIATYPPIVMGAAGNWAAGLNVLDTLPDTANHTYSIKASVSAGTITVVGNASAALSNALLVAQEC
jgi:hypothetical protein